MPRIVIYQKPTCTTCRQVHKALQETGVDFDAVDYYTDPIAKTKLKELLRKMNAPARSLLRTKEEIYRKLKLAERDLSDDELVDLMVKHPDLLQRPIVEKGNRAILARPAERLKEILFILIVCLAFATSVRAGQNATASPTPRLSPAEMEKFLRTAEIIAVEEAGAGVTGSLRATLSDGRITHDAHVQSVDVAKQLFQAGAHTELNFKDTYRYNIAAYRLASLLQIKNVPMSVEREVDGKTAAVTWWIDGVQFDEKGRLLKRTMGPVPLRTSNQIQLMYIWDELVQNRDRNTGNIIWTNDWTMWLIDHTRAFRLDDDLLKPEGLTRCDRALLGRLRTLTEDAIEQAVGDALTRDERRAVLKRRDRIVKVIDERVAKFGESVVLYDQP